MSAPVLTPSEQSEVTRFGVHDEDVIAWHEDEASITCEAPTGCDRPAVARFNQAIPPAYTEWLGAQALAHVELAA